MRFYYSKLKYNLHDFTKEPLDTQAFYERNTSKYAKCYDILKKAGCHVKISIFGHVYLDGVELTEEQIDDIISTND